ncbi:MAG: calcium/sodium antiporter [Deltaproteobacteria bacterium]
MNSHFFGRIDIDQIIAGYPTLVLIFIIIVCLVLVSKGADWMVEGVVELARRTGLSRLIIGATIVSLGTTTPEAVVSVMAAFMGSPGLALGNGVGSIIADTGLIFGLTCMLAVVPVDRYLLNRTGWVQAGAATLLVVIAVITLMGSAGEPTLSRGVGIFFLVLLGGYMYATYYWARKARISMPEAEDNDRELLRPAVCWLMIVGGLFLVVIGARVLIPCASECAYRFGVPDDVIAATMVAFGTSLPELITAIAAILKGYPEIALGNVVGADVLNCLFVIGSAAVARPLVIHPTFYTFHFPAMLVVLYSFRFFIFINKDNKFKRWQGAWLMAVYLIYVILQFALHVSGEPG